MTKFCILSIVILSCACIGVFASPVTSPKLIWYPKEGGKGVIPIFLEGKNPIVSPQAPSDQVRYYLYTQNTQNRPYELLINNHENLIASGFDISLPVKILVHGFTHSHTSGSTPYMKDAFLNSTNVNVIAVNWGPLAAAPWYETAAGHTRVVGEKTAELINFLLDEGSSMSHIHILGHSLGSHVAGFAGSALGGSLTRITALDPALPLFGQVEDDARIDPTDAVFVDVIHSAGGTLFDGGLAFREARGHIDFYPNSGEDQPGCGADAFGICSHMRAYEYYAESLVNPTGFRSCLCTSWEHFLADCPCTVTESMGEITNPSSRGLFYLRTNGAIPFALG